MVGVKTMQEQSQDKRAPEKKPILVDKFCVFINGMMMTCMCGTSLGKLALVIDPNPHLTIHY